MAKEFRPHQWLPADKPVTGIRTDLDKHYTGQDITEMDFPYLTPMLEESFSHWSCDTERLAISRYGVAVLYDRCGNPVSALRKPRSLNSGMMDSTLQALHQLALSIDLSHPVLSERQFVCEGKKIDLNLAVVPVYSRRNNLLIAVLGFSLPRGQGTWDEDTLVSASLHFRACFYQRLERFFIEDLIMQQRQIEKDSMRRNGLFLATKRLHDQIDVTSVLGEIMNSLETLYPSSNADLFLSQDYSNMDTRVRPLMFKHGANDVCARAFLEGKPRIESGPDNVLTIAVPMAGKQAIYGVIRLTVQQDDWDETDMPAFIILAETAGSAFENAKLYEQSNLLINELQLINELTKRLNQSLKLSEIFQFATNELLKIFHADYCCVLRLNRELGEFEVMSTNLPEVLSLKFPVDYGFCGTVYQTKEALIVSDYTDAHPVPSKLMSATASRSLIAAPITVNSEAVGVILVTHHSPNYFSYDNYKLLQVLSTHIGLAITNASLHAEVRRMVITDNLTGLHARHYLNEKIHLQQRLDPYGSLILVDIDHFKRINDTYGHQVGDEILTQVSQMIRACIRESDIAARWGGEELAVYLPKVRMEQAYRIAERIRSMVESETKPAVTVSCGVSEWTFEDEKISVESLFYQADMALYEAKNNGRNRVFIG